MKRFTQRARRVLSLAQEAAASLNSASIDTEHLLLGLMREDGGIAGRALRDLGLELRRLEELAEQLARSEERAANAQLDLSPDTKKALEFAVDEARRLVHHTIGSEHLLLGLIRLDDSRALDMLRRLGVAPERIRRQVAVALRESAAANAQMNLTSSPQRPAPRQFDYFLLRSSSRSSGGVSQMAVDLSPEIKDALEGALKELSYAGLTRLEERHLLTGLLQNRAGALRQLLKDAEVDPEDFMRQLRDPGEA